MNDISNQIIEKTKADLEERKRQTPLDALKRSDLVQGPTFQKTKSSLFESAMQAPKNGKVAIIGEIKLATPSEGDLGNESDVGKRAREYEEAGVDAISIVTEKYFFKGKLSFVTEIKSVSVLPILQKDFVLDEYQIYEAKKVGASAILFIGRILEKQQLIDFVDLAYSLEIEPVVEIHNESDLEKALSCSTSIIAANARDLDTMTVDVDRACLLIKKIPGEYTKLGFSGVSSKAEVDKYVQAGAEGVLVGTSLMKASDIKVLVGGLV